MESGAAVVHHHHYYPEGSHLVESDPRIGASVRKVGTSNGPGSVNQMSIIDKPINKANEITRSEPLTIIRNPQNHIRVVRDGVEKVVVDNPNLYKPSQAQENHSLKELQGVKVPDPPAKGKENILKPPPGKRLKFEKQVQPGENTIACPIEDPRNPYHKEYLKLKQLNDGHLKLENLNHSNPTKQRNSPTKSNVFRGTNLFRNPSNGQSAAPKQISKKLKNSNQGPSVPVNSKAQSPSDSQSNNVGYNPDLLQPPLPKVGPRDTSGDPLDEYHYCDDCDVAFKEGQPKNNVQVGYAYDGHLPAQVHGYGQKPVMVKSVNGAPRVGMVGVRSAFTR
jgi:hypothetical protein